MNLRMRLRFLGGLFAVTLLSLALFIYLEHSMARVSSIDARLQADSYTIGVEYPGIIEKQFIEEGSLIKANDALYRLRSSTLSNAIKNDELVKSSLLYSIDDQGKVVVRAAAPGRVRSIDFREGAFVPANSRMATVNLQDQGFISATFHLDAPDYARLTKQSTMTATFPDDKTVPVRIYDITMQTVNEKIRTTIRARFDGSAVNDNVFSVGTPLRTTLYLTDDTWYNRIRTAVSERL